MRELNPYFAGEGNGLPSDITTTTSTTTTTTATTPNTTTTTTTTASKKVGDGGASWRARALKHAVEQVMGILLLLLILLAIIRIDNCYYY